MAVAVVGLYGVWQRRRAIRMFASLRPLKAIAPPLGWGGPLARLGLVTLAMTSLVAIGAAQAQQVPLPAKLLPQFVDPVPSMAVASGPEDLTLTMCEFKSKVLPTGTFVPGTAPETWTWGYVVGTNCPTATQIGRAHV